MLLAAAGQSPYFGGIGEGEIQPKEQVLGRKAEGVGQQNEMRLLTGRNLDQILPGIWTGIQVRQFSTLQMKVHQFNIGEVGRGNRNRWLLLHLLPIADDSTTGTAEDQHRPQPFFDQRGQSLEFLLIMGGSKHHRQVGIHIS